MSLSPLAKHNVNNESSVTSHDDLAVWCINRWKSVPARCIHCFKCRETWEMTHHEWTAGRSPNPALRAASRYISLGWTTVPIPLQRGHPAVLYKGNHSDRKNFNSRRLREPCIDTEQKQHPAQWRGESMQWTVTVRSARCRWSCSNREHKQWSVMQTTPFEVATRARSVDWDSRQLSPSSGGGSDIKCCFHSGDVEPRSPWTLTRCVIMSLGGELRTGGERGLKFLCVGVMW